MTDIPEWAKERVRVLTNAEGGPSNKWITCHRNAFARYIAEHEEPPVDPLLIEAREMAAKVAFDKDWFVHGESIQSGQRDDHSDVQIALAALKRGMELAREEKP